MCCNITMRLHVAFLLDWSKFRLESYVQETIHVVAPPPVVGFLYVLEANRTSLRKTVHHTKKEKNFQY